MFLTKTSSESETVLVTIWLETQNFFKVFYRKKFGSGTAIRPACRSINANIGEKSSPAMEGSIRLSGRSKGSFSWLSTREIGL